MGHTAAVNFAPATRFPDLLKVFGCADVVADVDATGYGKRAGDLISRAANTRVSSKSTSLLDIIDHAPSSDRLTLFAATAASASLLALGAGAALLGM
jgi:hypothetical protein